jgi:NADH:ubiquinone oxidoreductase subunit H
MLMNLESIMYLCIYKNMSVYNVLELLIIMLIVLSLSSLLTVLERKGLAASQRRIGPTYNGWYGLLQIVQDGAKLVYKDYNKNNSVNNKYIAISCVLNFIYSYILFLFLYIDLILCINVSFIMLIVLIMLMINHISIILCGIIINNSKWTMLSSLRLIIVFIVYDIILFLLFVVLIPCNNLGLSNLSINNMFNINTYVFNQSSYNNLIKYPILFMIYLFVILIESGRVPIDIIEAESELISGYSIEYSGFLYALFASAEYSVMLFHSFLLSVLFFSYSSFYLTFVYITLIFLSFILIRSTLPRVIYTHLLTFCFHYLLPIPLLFVVLFSIV